MRRCITHKSQVPITKVKVTNDGQRFVTYKLCVHNNSIIAEVNLIKLNTMVKHNKMVKYNEKVCCAQNLGSHDQGQGPYKSSSHNN